MRVSVFLLVRTALSTGLCCLVKSATRYKFPLLKGVTDVYYITIDAGTTNTRLYLVKEGNNDVVAQSKKSFGIRNVAMSGSKSSFKNELSIAFREILTNNHCEPSNISFIVASGMITSNLGLLEVPYVTSPSTVNDLAKGAIIKKWPLFFNIPFIFIPGVRNSVPNLGAQNKFMDLNAFDVMRGEEVETLGLLEQISLGNKGLVILPGSHMKYILVDKQTILSSLSTLSGEMLSALQTGTILASSLEGDLVKTIDVDLLCQGFQAARSYGLSRALYHIRLSQLFEELEVDERANYFVGAVLAEDVKALEMSYLNETLNWIVIGGSNPLRASFVYILKRLGLKNIIETTDDQVLMSTIIGSKKVADLAMNRDS